jgi:hypothetical protein
LWPLVCAAGPALSLPESDRAMLEASLGRGVVGPSVESPAKLDPAEYFGLTQRQSLFQVIAGSNPGVAEVFRMFREPGAPEGPRWHYRFGDEEVGFLQMQPNGDLVLSGVEEIADRAVTRYDPPEPFLLQDLAPGEERETRMAVRVFAPDKPGEIQHRGALKVRFRHLGAYRVTVPAGAFDAVLMRSTFTGQVGPAKIEDSHYRFFAPGIGLLATAEHRDVSAYFLYRSVTKIGRVLAHAMGVHPTLPLSEYLRGHR